LGSSFGQFRLFDTRSYRFVRMTSMELRSFSRISFIAFSKDPRASRLVLTGSDRSTLLHTIEPGPDGCLHCIPLLAVPDLYYASSADLDADNVVIGDRNGVFENTFFLRSRIQTG
jgi:hypothetical protein